jgi:cyanophycinase
LIGNQLDVSVPVDTINRNGPKAYGNVPDQRTLTVDSGVLRNDVVPAGQAFAVLLRNVSAELNAAGRLTWNQTNDGGFVFNLTPGRTLPKTGVTFQYVIRMQDGRETRPTTVTISLGTWEWQDPRRANEDTTRDFSRGGLLLGGGDRAGCTDPIVKPAYDWLLSHANGGDIVFLQHSQDITMGDFLRFIFASPMHNRPRSVRLFSINARSQASLNQVINAVDNAEAIFIFGGEQSKYVDFWMGTPLQAAINRAINQRHVTIGGTSAGLAILAQVVFRDDPKFIEDNLESPQALSDPYTQRLVLAKDVIQNQALRNVVTDTHFGYRAPPGGVSRGRNRMGRLVTFVGRMMQDAWVVPALAKGIGVDNNTYVVVESRGGRNGNANVIGYYNAYFLAPTEAPLTCRPGQPLSFLRLRVRGVSSASGTFKFDRGWQAGAGFGFSYDVSATTVGGVATIRSNKADPTDIY